MSEKNSRWDEIRKIHIESATAYRILGGFVLVGIGVLLGVHFFAGDSGYGTNLYTEFISIAATVFVIDILNSRRDERRREQELKDRLLREARSPEGIIARHAYFELAEREMIYGEESVLCRANLFHSRPGKVDLQNANMEGAELREADFSNAELYGANLEKAILVRANLRDADLRRANLKNADLMKADLSGALLSRADLTGADLMYANAKQTGKFIFWANATGDAEAKSSSQRQLILPDGSRATPETDMSRFTDPNHPDFWRSDDPQSPAYRESFMSKLVREFRKSDPPPQSPPPPAGGDPT